MVLSFQNANGEYIMTEVNATETVETVATVPVNKYKKTDRVRKAKLHETLEANLRNTERALAKATGREVTITVTRNADPSAARYARAIFDATFAVSNGRTIPVRGKTAEEIMAVARGMRLALDLMKAE